MLITSVDILRSFPYLTIFAYKTVLQPTQLMYRTEYDSKFQNSTASIRIRTLDLTRDILLDENFTELIFSYVSFF